MDFADFARSHGLIIDRLYADGKVHRVPTAGKPRSKNGAYLFDGVSGFVQAWDTHASAIGYRDGKPGERITRIDMAKIQAEEREKRQRAAKEALAIIGRCRPDIHPYLARKGFAKANGLVDIDGRLVIPMRDFRAYGRVNSVQWISESGEKKFLPGGAAKGSVMVIGTGPDDWLCEGYATGLSVQAALKSLFRQSRVVVCFSAGNLRYIASLTDRKTFVMADNDASETGQAAAQDTKLPWVMPPEVGTDANDMHMSMGVRALAELMRKALPA